MTISRYEFARYFTYCHVLILVAGCFGRLFKFVYFLFVFNCLVDDYVHVAKDKHGYNVEQVC